MDPKRPVKARSGKKKTVEKPIGRKVREKKDLWGCEVTFRARIWTDGFPSLSERTVEYAFALSQLPHVRGRRVLDVGVGPYPSFWYMLTSMRYRVVGTDKRKRYADKKIGSQSVILEDDMADSKMKGKFSAIFCISTLEHIDDYNKAVENMRSLSKEGAVVVITVPYDSSVFEPVIAYKPKIESGDVTRMFGRPSIDEWTKILGRQLDVEYWKCWTGEEWRQGDRLFFPKRVAENVADLICISWKV